LSPPWPYAGCLLDGRLEEEEEEEDRDDDDGDDDENADG
jgi:hypothetical protein